MKHYLKLAVGIAALSATVHGHAAESILNASYDVARELFEQYNPVFAAHWKKKTGKDIEINQSHAGSSKQARSIVEGLAADVVTFNQSTDIDFLYKTGGWVAKDWTAKFPNGSSPYYSFNTFLVRKGNPKGIKDWGDLAKPGVQVIFPNPKTSGNGRYTFLAALNWARNEFKGDQAKIDDYLGKVIANVPVFDTGGRGATTTFAERGQGDVLITFESETKGIRKQFGEDKFDIVTPPTSVLADFPVAVVDKVVDKRGTREVATAYLEFLYSPEGQEVLAKNYYRVRDPKVAEAFAKQFPKIDLATVEESFGGWAEAQKTYFDANGVFDQLLEKSAAAKAK